MTIIIIIIQMKTIKWDQLLKLRKTLRYKTDMTSANSTQSFEQTISASANRKSNKMRSLSETNPSRFIRQSYYWAGLWPSASPSLVYLVFGYVFQSVFFFCYTSFKCIYAFTTRNMEEIVLCSFVSLTEVALCVKVLNMHFRMRVIQQHLHEIHSFQLETTEEATLVDGRCRTLTKMLFAYIGLVMVTGFFSYSVPFFLDEPTLPYLGWYPLDWYHNRSLYWLVYSYQVAGMIIQSHILVCMEMYTVYMFVMLSSQFDILCMRLKKIGWNNTGAEDTKAGHISNATANAKLIDCIAAHRTISGLFEIFSMLLTIHSLSPVVQYKTSQ